MMFGKYFCGNLISEYGRKNGRVDYATLAKAFDAVLNNDIMSATGYEFWEQENGFIDNSEEIETIEQEIDALQQQLDNLEISDFEDPATYEDLYEELTQKIDILEDDKTDLENYQNYEPEIYQYYIISDSGADLLKDYTNEIVFYNSDLDMYVWGVTHFGTSWSYVLTDIQCEKETGEK